MDGLPVDVKRTVPAKRLVFPREPHWPERAEPGAYEIYQPTVWLVACPGCGDVSAMTVGYPKPADRPSWELTGTDDAPTLTPSVNCTGCCGWHGYLTAGVFRPC